jgi:hypothetical protein
MLRVQNLIAADPLAAVRTAARDAARREAMVQLARLQAIDLTDEEPHHKVLIRRWRSELRQVLGRSRAS